MLTWEKDGKGDIKPKYNGKPVAWAALPGSQEKFLSSIPIFEVLYSGNRGPGKTEALLMTYLRFVGKGFGHNWQGIIFRRTYRELEDIIKKSHILVNILQPKARFNKKDNSWNFLGGEELKFRRMEREQDYWAYHGHMYPFIGWEELTNWPNDSCYKIMFSCSRSPSLNVPRIVRATTNPYGVGHNWVKERFQLPQGFNKLIYDRQEDGSLSLPRTAINGLLKENIVLLNSDPDYPKRIISSATSPQMAKAWLNGSWEISSGGVFDDLFSGETHIIPPIPSHKIPREWEISRSFDWGSSKPFAVLWFARSNGEPMKFTYKGKEYTIGDVPGDIFLFKEYYGCSRSENNKGLKMLARDVAINIVEIEEELEIFDRVTPGPADSSIFTESNGNCIATDMENQGVYWTKSFKGAGSRVQGWLQLRKLLSGALPIEGGREFPGLFICSNAKNTIRTLPTLPRCPKNPEDVDTTAEDHIADALRYYLYSNSSNITYSSFY